MAGAAGTLASSEVPVVGGDRIRWIELNVPSSSPLPAEPCAPMAPKNAAACNVIDGNPPAYLIWRIHENLRHVLEVVELFACEEYPETGLHLVFKDALCPFAFSCKNESEAGNAYLLYVMTVSGVAYLIKLRSLSAYISGSTFPRDDIVELNMQASTQVGKITAVAATSGCLVTGWQDGSIGCYQLGKIDPHAPDFFNELRDDVGIGRIWNIMSRAKVVGAVQDMLISQVCGRKIIFALHLDGFLRVWDLASHTRVLNHNLNSQKVGGIASSRLWVADTNYRTDLISIAVLHESPSVSGIVAVYKFSFILGDKISLSSEPSMQMVHLGGKLIDLKISSTKLWILKEDGLLLYDLCQSDCSLEHIVTYDLQEDFVADQLFQNSENTLDDLIWSNNSIFTLTKDQIACFISSIFLRRLLQPGVYQSSALRAIIADHKKSLSDHEFQSLTVSGLKKEILAIIEGEGVGLSQSSVVYYWKKLCAQYFHYWCQKSMPYGLFIGSSNELVGLIRKSSISVFRSLEVCELLIYGSSEFLDQKSSDLIFPDNDIDCELLTEVLRFTSDISHQLGRVSTAIFYESLVCPFISSDVILFHLLKILETGYISSSEAYLVSQVGIDINWERKQAAHKSHRKFSIEMLLSLHALRTRAISWSKVLDVLEKYLNYLNPQKSSETFESRGVYNINYSLLVQATSQVGRVMFESAFDVLLFLSYMVNVSAQIDMWQTDVIRIKLKLIPMIHEILTQWLILHFFGITPTTAQIADDFNSRLSSLHIGNKTGKRSRDGKLGSLDFPLACLLDFPSSSDGKDFPYSTSFPNPREFIHSVQRLSSLVLWDRNGEGSSHSFSQIVGLASTLLSHGQYEAVENLLLITDAHTNRRKLNLGVQSTDGELFARLHLLGFSLLLQAQNGMSGIRKEQKIHEAIRCFFRAASGREALLSLKKLSSQTGFFYSGESDSVGVWRYHYYQWAMQMFEQYGISDGACQFALAALEQVDEVLASANGDIHAEILPEPSSTVRGRLWANVFKFTLDLKLYRDAYCAIISNPDEESKYICLRRFIIVLCELGASKVLCDGKLPFIGLVEKVEQELVWKAERSDITSKPNMYKLLYAFEAYRNNWRKAAGYMYGYCVRLRKEATSGGTGLLSSALQEIVVGLSTTINALQLVDDAYAWIDSPSEIGFANDQISPNKRPRNIPADLSSISAAPSCRMHHCVNVEMLEKEYVLTSAQYLLTLVNNRFKLSGDEPLEDLVGALIQEGLYDMAFTVILKFWEGSGLKKELEGAFIALSQNCCLNRVNLSSMGSSMKANNLLLLPPGEETYADEKTNANSVVLHSKGNTQWETLELYLEKYKALHPRLPVIVAETLLHTDPQIELPLWLVHMFKGGRRVGSWGMTGQESDPATLFRLYVDYGRHTEATNLLLEYLEAFASPRPADAFHRKKMSAVWFPYTAIERLWCQLEELRNAGHMVDHCDKLKKLLQGALLNHLTLLKVDSEDAVASGLGPQMQDTDS